MVLEIKKYGDPVLRMKALPIVKMNKEILTLADNMLSTMYEADGVGLAANQVGIPIRIIVLDIGEGPIKLFNPHIVADNGKGSTMKEGCLSVPGLTGEVTRWEHIVVEAMTDDSLEIKKFEADGLFARALQHEIDHLDGILFIDKAKNLIEEQEDGE